MGFPAADTFDSIIDECALSLTGQGANNDIVVSLVGNITSGSTTIVVDDDSILSRGIIEIDDELIYVSSVDGATATVPAWGRGYRQSTAAAHTSGAAVRVNPQWPRSVIAREVNNTVRSLYPTLYAPKTTEITMDSIEWQYEMPADSERILAVDWKWTTTQWISARSFELLSSTNTTDFTTGKAIALGEPIPSGATVRVTYAARPTVMSTGAGVFSTVTGLPASCKDVVVLGTCARLLPWVDTARASVEAAEAMAMAGNRATGVSVQIASAMQKRYEARLAEEKRALSITYRPRVHNARR
jgi:hypothetical protein